MSADRPDGRIAGSSVVYGEVLDFLIDEAALLDDDRYDDWLGLLTDDVQYQMPVRRTVHRRDGDGFVDDFHFRDDRRTLQLRARRNADVPSAFDRDPPPRIRRLVSNLVVRTGDADGELRATSSIAVWRNRLDATDFDLLVARREDTLRRTDAGLRLARRTILLDQARVAAVFLNVLV